MFDAPMVIQNDPGGVVLEYIERERFLEFHGTKIIIDGRCASACTIYLKSPHACVTARASLHFHEASFVFGSNAKRQFGWRDDRGTAVIMSLYPPNIADWIMAHGGLGRDMITLKGREMLSLVKACDSGGR